MRRLLVAMALAVLVGLYVLAAPALAAGGWTSTFSAADKNGDGVACFSAERESRGLPPVTDDTATRGGGVLRCPDHTQAVFNL